MLAGKVVSLKQSANGGIDTCRKSVGKHGRKEKGGLITSKVLKIYTLHVILAT